MKQLLPLILFSFYLFSCIEYKEKLKIEQDGSGEITFAVGINDAITKMDGTESEGLENFDEQKIREKYKDKKGIEFIESRTYNEKGNKWIEVKLHFDSLYDLTEASKDSSNQGMIGVISLEEDKDGNMLFVRKLGKDDAKSDEDSSNADMGKGMMDLMFSKYEFNYELTLPGKIISANAEENNIDRENNTVKWTVTMSSLISRPKFIVTFEKSSSNNLVLVLALVLFSIVFALFLLRLLKRK